MAVRPFPLTDVRLLDSPCKVAQDANQRYLRSLDFDSLLYTFRQNAGLPTPGQPFGGWEAPTCEVRGHFIGHYLSACALMYASAGDEGLKTRAEAMVGELAKCQQALGGEYLSAFPESFFDRLESMQNVPWAIYYTIHKIMAGLLDVYQYCGCGQALDVLQGMASYFHKRTGGLSIHQMDRILTVEFGGMSEVLHNLYAITQNPQHLELAHRFDRAEFLGPLSLEHDNLSRIHANTHIPEICGAARRYELLCDERYRTVTRFFWDCVVNTRTYATGGSNEAEHWPDPGKLAGTLTASNQESCTTYNMLKVTRYLYTWTGETKYAELYQRAYLNGILGTQDPETGMLEYFLPLAAGHSRTYGTPTDSFWCCYGTGIESFAKLGDSIYFHGDDAVYVNLLVPSVARWAEKGVTLEQRTGFPREEGTTISVRVAQPTAFSLNLLVPHWAEKGASATLNGEMLQTEAMPGSYLRIDRTWTDGDTLQVSMPMSLRAEAMPDDPELVALMYGPLVLAGLTDKPVYFLADASRPQDWVKPVEGEPLTFRTSGQVEDLTFVPLNETLHRRYGVYFVVTHEGSEKHKAILAEEEAKRRLLARVVDSVTPMDEAGEKAHGLQGERTGAGPHLGRAWRHATDGGWWSWDLKVLPDVPMTLQCTYWGSDAGQREFDILVDGQLLATQKLERNAPDRLFDVQYPIPPVVTKGKAKVTVKFQGHPGNFAGGVFGCAVLKPEG